MVHLFIYLFIHSGFVVSLFSSCLILAPEYFLELLLPVQTSIDPKMYTGIGLLTVPLHV